MSSSMFSTLFFEAGLLIELIELGRASQPKPQDWPIFALTGLGLRQVGRSCLALYVSLLKQQDFTGQTISLLPQAMYF